MALDARINFSFDSMIQNLFHTLEGIFSVIETKNRSLVDMQDLVGALPFKFGEVNLYAQYNYDHYNNPTKDYASADIWYHKSFFVILVLGYLLLQAAMHTSWA